MRILPRSILLCLVAVFITACVQEPYAPATPPTGTTVGIVAATQPTGTVELMAGYIPEERQKAPQTALLTFDTQMIALVRQNCTYTRTVVALPSEQLSASSNKDAGENSAADHWIAVGARAGVDLLILPQILHWHEREGGEMGAGDSAEVFIQFFLIDVNAKKIAARSVMREKQQSLSGNLLDIRTFLKRGGKWLTAQQLADEGIINMTKEFGL